ncbi:hypothetical protein TUM3792_45290 [Shewanella sp. MBTL60-007]|nr:hypothetical protein TUM3792_45290 [Shewanella sp. MBTL60-007]
MKLKSLIVSLSLASTCLLSANASANTGTINFIGSISTTTCEIQVATDGVISPDHVVDLGSYLVSDVNTLTGGAHSAFGTIKDVTLIPDPSTCSVPADFAGGAEIKVSTNSTFGPNSNVITSDDSAISNAGIEFLLGGVTPILNKTVSTTDGVDYDSNNGEVQFTAQPYALGTVAPGPISGTATFSVSYK